MAEDIDKLAAWARSQGWEVRTDANGYRRFYNPDGIYVVRYPATPSNPRRRLLEVEGGIAVSEWNVFISYATSDALTEQDLDTLADIAETCDAMVANRRAGAGFSVILHIQAKDALSAAEQGVGFARDKLRTEPPGEIVDLRVTTPEQFEAETLRPDFPPLASAADAAEILGVSRQRVHQLAASNTLFPAPVARVATGPLWTVPAIEHFDRVWERKPGRPGHPRNTKGQFVDVPAPALRVVRSSKGSGEDSLAEDDQPHRQRA